MFSFNAVFLSPENSEKNRVRKEGYQVPAISLRYQSSSKTLFIPISGSWGHDYFEELLLKELEELKEWEMWDTLIDGGEWQPIPCEKLDNYSGIALV